MALAPDAAALLAAIGDARPRFETMTGEEARANSRSRRATQVEGPSVGWVGEHDAPGPGGPVRVRHYRPIESSDPLPVIVFLHGGGWVIGDLESHDAICRRLAIGTECAVIAVDYRLAPEHPFPAAIDDATAAVAWVARNAVELAIDPARLLIAGDSAGANLAAVVARRAREVGLLLRGQVLIYPLTDGSMSAPSWTEHADGPFVTAASMAWFWEQYTTPTQRRHPDASPLCATDLTGLPPALVVTAEHDVLRDEGEWYAAALRTAGVSTQHVRFDGAFHGFFGFVDQLDAARRANELVNRFITIRVSDAVAARTSDPPSRRFP